MCVAYECMNCQHYMKNTITNYAGVETCSKCGSENLQTDWDEANDFDREPEYDLDSYEGEVDYEECV